MIVRSNFASATLPVSALLLLLPLAASATVPDKYGVGARSMGSGGGGVAMVENGAAAHLNPAGLGRIRRPTATMGVSTALTRFRTLPDLYWDTNRDGVLDERDEPLAYSPNVRNATGFHITAGRNIGGKFGLGIYAYMPPSSIIRFGTFEPDLPNYFMYSNRPLRYVAAAGVGGEIIRGVNIGASVDFVPKARYDVFLTIDSTITGSGSDDVEDLVGEIEIDVHEMSLDVVPDFAPTVGVQLELGRWHEKLQGLVIGASYRGSVGLPIDVNIDLQANISASDIGDLEPFVLPIILKSGLKIYDHYVPPVLNLGIAYRTDQTFSAYADARWTNWRKMIINVARLSEPDVQSPLVNLDDQIVDGNDYSYDLRSVWALRMGTELRLPRWEFDNRFRYLRVTVRGGFGYEPTALVSQGSNSALLDSNRTFFTVGAGAETWDPLNLVDGALRLDLFAQYHVLASGSLPRSADVPTNGYPVEGGTLPIGGNVFVAGIQWGFDY